ncbi:MAG: CBS domain-containing protein [bacterium]
MSLLASLVKSQQIITLPSSASVFEAAQKMAEHRVGSVLIMEGEKLTGIFTERDLLNRVVAQDLDAKKTPLMQVMSKNVTTVPLQEAVENCFKRMETTKCRHIPIVEGERVVGVVTMRNILEWLTREMEEENVFLKSYIQS